MAWFKVDDKLHDHRKTRAVRRSHAEKHRDVAPFGLWVLAGSWAGGNGTAGFVPFEVVAEWDDHALMLARRLVDAGLWWETEVDGEPGYGFHDWDAMNPAMDGSDPSISGSFGNHVRWHVKRDKIDEACGFCRGDDRPDIAPTSDSIGGESLPSRPDPTRPDPKNMSTGAGKEALEAEFAIWYAKYPRKTGKGAARKAYAAARKKTTAETLLGSLVEQVGIWERAKTEARFIPHPATWLNGERWDDEDAPEPKASGQTEWWLK